MLDAKTARRNRTIVVVVTMSMVAISWLGFIDSAAVSYVNEATVQALAAFAGARVINATISLLSSLEVHVSFFGGFGIQPFQVLDPIDDLVQQYSSVMKFAIGSLVIQKILIEIVSTTLFKLLLTALSGGFIVSLYLDANRYSKVMMKLFLMAALIRLLIVVVVLLNGMVDRAFIDDRTHENLATVDTAVDEANRAGLTSALTDEERTQITNTVAQLEAKKLKVLEKLREQQKALENGRSQLEESQQTLSDFEITLGAIERHNVFSRNADHRALIDAVSALRDQVKEQAGELEHSTKQLEKLDKDIASASMLLMEGTQSESGFTRLISNVRNMVNMESLKVKLEGAMISMLNLMAIFVLKTLIMPLVFLGLLLKGFKSIWGIDPRNWLSEEIQYIQQPSDERGQNQGKQKGSD